MASSGLTLLYVLAITSEIAETSALCFHSRAICSRQSLSDFECDLFECNRDGGAVSQIIAETGHGCAHVLDLGTAAVGEIRIGHLLLRRPDTYGVIFL
jgi:uncharacterized protein (UPF0261 family)